MLRDTLLGWVELHPQGCIRASGVGTGECAACIFMVASPEKPDRSLDIGHLQDHRILTLQLDAHAVRCEFRVVPVEPALLGVAEV